MSFWRLILLLMLQAGSVGSVFAASFMGYEFDPSLNWFVAETDHFLIHCPSRTGLNKEEEALMRHLATIAETTYHLLTPFIHWRPKDKVNVIVTDFADYAAGFALPFPQNTIFLTVTPPAGDLTNYGNWLVNLFLHEYTHILQMDKVAGLPSFLRKIFGRAVVPNAWLPFWFTEGLAIYNETRFTGFGRANSNEYAMKIRTAALAKKLLPIDQTTTYELRKYPASEAPYLYGSQFLNYLANRFGETKLIQYTDYYAKYLPFWLNFSAKRIFGNSFNNLWQEWQTELKKTVNEPVESLTESQPVTKIGFELKGLQFSCYGEKVYFISYNPNELPSIKSLDLITKEQKTLLKGWIGKTLSVSPDGSKLLFSLRNIFKNYYEYDDIFFFSLTTKELYRITNGLRARDPAFAPFGDEIVFVENHLGKNRLMLMNWRNKKTEVLMEEDDYTQFSQPRFSPDGKKIAVAVGKEDGYQDILVIDLETGWKLPITFDLAIDIQPTWTSDGKYLLFSSDRTGVFNLFAYSFAHKRIYQVTNVRTGAFAPTISPDGKRIGFLLYSVNGYDIHFIDFKPSLWQIVEKTKPVPTLEDSTRKIGLASWETQAPKLLLYQYDPLASIFPKFWLPLVNYDTTFSFGFFTAGIDALFQHLILLTANYQPKTKSPSVYLSYLSQKFPLILSGYYENAQQGGKISGYFPFYATFSYHLLLPYYEFDRKLNSRSSGLGLEWQTSNAKRYLYSVSPVDGRTFWIDLSYYSRYLGSNYNLAKFKGSYSEYLALPIAHNVFAFRISGATALGDSNKKKQYRFGGTQGLFAIRGYPQDSIAQPNALKITLEYRCPIAWIERGFKTAPVFLSNFSGLCGLDAGLGWNNFTISSWQNNSKIGAFIELNSSLIIAYFVPLTIKIGFAYGLLNAQKQIYFNAGSSLLNLLWEKRRITRKDLIDLRTKNCVDY